MKKELEYMKEYMEAEIEKTGSFNQPKTKEKPGEISPIISEKIYSGDFQEMISMLWHRELESNENLKNNVISLMGRIEKVMEENDNNEITFALRLLLIKAAFVNHHLFESIKWKDYMKNECIKQ